MASLLSFAWRKAASSASPNASSSRLDPKSDVNSQPPGVTTSSSGDTLYQPASSDSLFSTVSCITGPYTPEALRRRKSPQEIRAELGLPCKKLSWKTESKDTRGSYSKASACASPSSCSLLPPMLGTYGALPSPQISTSSFYSKGSRSFHNVARSPSIKVGKAKTAVGALLAMNETKANDIPMAPENVRLRPESSILPCREWLRDDRSITDEANDFSVELPYESLNGSQCSFPSKPYGITYESDEESSIHASPSSNRGSFARNLPNTSFTRGFLEAEANQCSEDKDRYDFHPIVERELIVADEHNSVNVSCMSQSIVKEMESLCSMAGENDVPSFLHSNIQCDEQQFRSKNERRIKEDFLLSILERLQDDNEIVMEVMNAMETTRGYSDMSTRQGVDNLFSGFSSSSREHLLEMMDNRLSVLRSSGANQGEIEIIDAFAFCQSLVHASIPQHEKTGYISCSNSTITPQYAHRWRHIAGLRTALGFHEVHPESPPLIRGGDTSLFSLPSESVNDATPHTSNVSMSSTITSAVSPDRMGKKISGFELRRGKMRQSMESVCTGFCALSAECRKLVAESQPEETRGSTLMIQRIYHQLLSITNEELKELIDSFELVLLNVDITRVVSEDQADEIDPTASESFLAQPQPLVRSWGHIENRPDQQVTPQTMGLTLERLDLNLVEEEREDQENHNIFSPDTLDMRSIDQSPGRYHAETIEEDDLRRTVGSFDQYDYQALEERDEPPNIEPQQHQGEHGTRGKWSKGRLSIFRRQRRRRPQAAE